MQQSISNLSYVAGLGLLHYKSNHRQPGSRSNLTVIVFDEYQIENLVMTGHLPSGYLDQLTATGGADNRHIVLTNLDSATAWCLVEALRDQFDDMYFFSETEGGDDIYTASVRLVEYLFKGLDGGSSGRYVEAVDGLDSIVYSVPSSESEINHISHVIDSLEKNFIKDSFAGVCWSDSDIASIYFPLHQPSQIKENIQNVCGK